MDQVALVADSLSFGSVVESRIRSRMSCSLLPDMYSTVLSGENISGQSTAQINFPEWFGKNSKTKKRSRLAQEIYDHTRLRTSASRQSTQRDYAPLLLKNIVQPLIKNQNEGVKQALSVIKEYGLLHRDINSLVELTTWPGEKNPMESVDSRVKTALKRAVNNETVPYSYTAITTTKKRKLAPIDDDYLNEHGEEGNDGSNSGDDEDEDDERVTKNILKLKNDANVARMSKRLKFL